MAVKVIKAVDLPKNKKVKAAREAKAKKSK